MATYELRDANIVALSLVKEGANRKRFYLRKSAKPDRLDFDGPTRIVKSADWSAVYCVVAEPGAPEDQGVGDTTGAGDVDVWTADEIRKASHRFMRNGALVNKMHEDLEPFGEVVENFLAPADFTVDGTVIKAGSWCIGICPSPEGRDLIEKGELGGVSIQGDAMRALIAKTDEEKPATMNRLLNAIAKKVGIDPAEIEKAAPPTFSQIINRRELHEELPTAIDALREAIYDAYYPYGIDGEQPTVKEIRSSLSTSLSEFGDHILDLFDGIQAGTIRKSAEEIATELATLRPNDQSPEEDTVDAAQIASIVKSSVEEANKPLTDQVTTLAADVATLKKAAEDAKEPTLAELREQQAELAKGFQTVSDNIAKLAAGDSSLELEDDPRVQGDVVAQVRKSIDPQFSGVLLA